MKKTSYLLIVALLLANILVGCSPQAESIEAPGAFSLDVGSTMPLTFTILPEDAKDKTLLFASSDETIVLVDETGTVEGVSPGSAKVTATTVNGISAEVDVTVTLPVVSVSAEKSLTLDIGLTGCVNAQIHPQEATDSTLSYASDDEKVATVDEAGVVTALAAGEATITITAHNGQQAKTIIVVETPVHGVELDRESVTIYIGGTETLGATVLPQDATHQDLTWESSNEEIAAVDETGIVTALAQGEATITATAHNSVSASCTVTVAKSPPAGGTSGTQGGSGSAGGTSGTQGGSGSAGGGSGTQGGSESAGGGSGGNASSPAPTLLTDAQIEQAIAEAKSYAAGLGFTIVSDRQPGHSIASVAYYDYDAFVQNLKDNVSYVASLVGAGEDLSQAKLCFVREGSSVYVTYG